MKTATRCVHHESDADAFGAIVPPIYQTATFRQPAALEFGEYDYTRSANPTRTILERQLAALEGGTYACAFASGMAALTALTRLVQVGDEIVAGDDLYGGTVRLLEQVLPRHGVTVRYVDTSNIELVRREFNSRTKLLLVETPTNPLLRISDIRELAQLARDARVLLAVDNSMLSPYLQQPLTLGADVVVHSATKFLCGHSDVTAGAIVTNDAEIHRRISFYQNAEGAGLSPFESWLLLRGIKTLALRVEHQNAAATEIAEYLRQHSSIERVYYPGLTDHPGHEIHKKQASGAGAVISFTTGDERLSQLIVEGTRLFEIAVSFGSVSSVITLPRRMSHAAIPDSLKNRLAPPDDLVRISVGIEDVGDLIDDLDYALNEAHKRRAKTAAAYC